MREVCAIGPSLYENPLCEIFGLGPCAHNTRNQGVYPLRVTLDEHPEGVGIPAYYSCHTLYVGKLVHCLGILVLRYCGIAVLRFVLGYFCFSTI
jgi:hypothetical protein